MFLIDSTIILRSPHVRIERAGFSYALVELPVDLHANAFPYRIVTLKNRTLSPVVERFLICVREVAASFAGKPAGRTARSLKSNTS